jgi:hypothetical protein
MVSSTHTSPGSHGIALFEQSEPTPWASPPPLPALVLVLVLDDDEPSSTGIPHRELVLRTDPVAAPVE